MKFKISSRIGFMIQDVIDLRQEQWVPRCNNSTLKLIKEIKNEATKQSMTLFSFKLERSRYNHHRK